MNKDEYLKILNESPFRETYNTILDRLNQIRTQIHDYKVTQIVNYKLEYSYFYATNPFLIEKKCRLTIIFDHSTFKLELWLVAQNRKTDQLYRSRFSEYPQNSLSLAMFELDDNILNQNKSYEPQIHEIYKLLKPLMK